MDLLWKICLGIIAIPLFLWGLSFVLQFLLGAGIGVLSIFSVIWDKEEQLSFGTGFFTGVLFVVARFVLLFILSAFLSIIDVGYGFADMINMIINWLAIAIFIVGIIRAKFKFAFGFILANEILAYLITKFID